MSRSLQETAALLRGLQLIAEAVLKEQQHVYCQLWANSSVREVVDWNVGQCLTCLRRAGENPTGELKKLTNLLQETGERGYVVAEGLRQLVTTKVPAELQMTQRAFEDAVRGRRATASDNVDSINIGGNDNVDENENVYVSDAAHLDISSITLKELEDILSRHHKDRQISLSVPYNEQRPDEKSAEKEKTPMTTTPDSSSASTTASTSATTSSSPSSPPTSSSPSDAAAATSSPSPTPTPASAPSPSPAPTPTPSPSPSPSPSASVDTLPSPSSPSSTSSSSIDNDTAYVENVLKFVAQGSAASSAASPGATLPQLSSVSKQRRVPSTRLGRMASFGGLFAGLGFGTVNELTKGALGLGGATTMKEALLSPANAERIVDTLCKVRGAALKIGQILSIQDSKVVSPQLTKAFERVRQAADYMPDWQVNQVMVSQFGDNWRQHLITFDEKPFAAASIGQVHRATLKATKANNDDGPAAPAAAPSVAPSVAPDDDDDDDGIEVAIKIQYPGVATSIESDIDNLVGVLKVWKIFPHGFFIDNVVKVAKRELSWEVDYKREAEYTEKFREMIAPYPEYYVPKVIRRLSTTNVLTTELVPGVPLDQCFNMSVDHRLAIAEGVLKLCLRELFELQCMQTDPNWSNFLYDVNSRRLMLIDFGSTRFYPKEFIRNYRNVIMAAVHNNRQGVLTMSQQMGFLTGYESKQMEEAHVDAVMILGEIFSYDGNFDFGKQNTTERLSQLVPTMVAHRLCPPPEEIYSIHRKLSGIFLLCSRLNVKMNCRPFYEDIVINKFKE